MADTSPHPTPRRAAPAIELTREVLHKRYSAFSDQALVAARAAGSKNYSPLAWEVIRELIKARGLSLRSLSPVTQLGTPPAALPPAPARSSRAAPTVAASPFLLVSRQRGLRWSADDPLPLTARDVMAVAALIYGIAGLSLVVGAFMNRGPVAAQGPGVLGLGAVGLVSLAFAGSSKRPPSPRWWWLATLYCGISPALALARIGSATGSRWPQLLLGALLGILWVVYFGRRRATYGLAPWRWLG
jgi:hypothetical protein